MKTIEMCQNNISDLLVNKLSINQSNERIKNKVKFNIEYMLRKERGEGDVLERRHILIFIM